MRTPIFWVSDTSRSVRPQKMARGLKFRFNRDCTIGRFQAIKTDVLLIFSFITGDKTEFLSPMMFSNEYITGI